MPPPFLLPPPQHHHAVRASVLRLKSLISQSSRMTYVPPSTRSSFTLYLVIAVFLKMLTFTAQT